MPPAPTTPIRIEAQYRRRFGVEPAGDHPAVMTVGRALWPAQLSAAERAVLDPGIPPDVLRSADVLVVGGGIIGIATAAACQQTRLAPCSSSNARSLARRRQRRRGPAAARSARGRRSANPGRSRPARPRGLARAGRRRPRMDWLGLERGAQQFRGGPTRRRTARSGPGGAPGCGAAGADQRDLRAGAGAAQPAARAGPAGHPWTACPERRERGRDHSPWWADHDGLFQRGRLRGWRGDLRDGHRTASAGPGDAGGRPLGARSRDTCWSPGRPGCACLARSRRWPPPSTMAGSWSAARSISGIPSVSSGPRWWPRCGAKSSRRGPRPDSIEIEYAWACLPAAHPDHLPTIDRVPTLANAWVASGHYKTGILLAPATAQLLADWVGSGNRPALAAEVSIARFAGAAEPRTH